MTHGQKSKVLRKALADVRSKDFAAGIDAGLHQVGAQIYRRAFTRGAGVGVAVGAAVGYVIGLWL